MGAPLQVLVSVGERYVYEVPSERTRGDTYRVDLVATAAPAAVRAGIS